VDHVLDALRTAGDAYALLPPLPPGVRSVHVRILSAMERLGAGGGHRVSDINAALGTRLPNTTRFINELVELKAVRKVRDDSDKRVVLVRATEIGERYTERYVRRFHGRMAEAFARIGQAECFTMIETIHAVGAAMEGIHQDAPGKGKPNVA
jgi:DNA-binding MarR family transcriptional regulator